MKEKQPLQAELVAAEREYRKKFRYTVAIGLLGCMSIIPAVTVVGIPVICTSVLIPVLIADRVVTAFTKNSKNGPAGMILALPFMPLGAVASYVTCDYLTQKAVLCVKNLAEPHFKKTDELSTQIIDLKIRIKLLSFNAESKWYRRYKESMLQIAALYGPGSLMTTLPLSLQKKILQMSVPYSIEILETIKSSYLGELEESAATG